MIELFRNPNYDFIGKHRWAYFASTELIVVALGSLVSQRLRYDVDFTGGTLIQVRLGTPTTPEVLRTALDRIRGGDNIIQQFGDSHEYIIRTHQQHGTSGDLAKQVEPALAADRAFGHVEIRRVEFVGPQVGEDLLRQAVYAVIAALTGIVAYIGIRFDVKGVIVAVVHDVIICLGALALTQREFSLPVLATVLTVVGYSVNDTIVAYDRLRENRTRLPSASTSFADRMAFTSLRKNKTA